MNRIAIQFLIAFSALLGVQSTPNDGLSDWQIIQNWQADGKYDKFIAASINLSHQCQGAPDSFLEIPMIIHGTHVLTMNGHVLVQFGQENFQSFRSFYGAPRLSCHLILDAMEEGADNRVVWSVVSYTKYFARFNFFPRLIQSSSLHNVFSEVLHVIGAGAAMVMALFSLTMFFGKVGRQLTYSLALSCVFAAIYFGLSTAGLFGMSLPMLEAHRWADVSVWLSIGLFVNALRVEGLLGSHFFRFYFVNVVVGIVIILFGDSGDVIQLGTTFPFAASALMLVILLVRTIGDILTGSQIRRRRILHAWSLGSFVLACFNEMFVVSGIYSGVPLLPMGFMAGTFFLVLAVNERIMEAYAERDYLRANLEIEVEKKTVELKKKTNELESAMVSLKSTQAELVQSAKLASLGTLSAGIAHEINNSLNYVNGALRPLEKKIDQLFLKNSSGVAIDGGERKKLAQLIDVMKEGLNLTLEIIKSLRTYTGLNQAKFNDVNLRSIVSSSLTILKTKTRGKIDVKVDIPEDLVVFGSVVGINQILMNLISNSIDAMDNGGELEIGAKVIDDQWIEVKISDTGRGMDAKTQERIFEPFYTTKEVGSGTGLGMYIVRGEVDRHKGRIFVESQLGKGTSFLIHFPVTGEVPSMEAG